MPDLTSPVSGLLAFLSGVSLPPLLLLLLAGHLLGDFTFQTRWMVDGKHRNGVLLAHVAVLTLVHFLVLIPFAGIPVAGACLVIGGLHGAIDLSKSRLAPSGSAGGLSLFLLDQLAHLMVLLIAFAALATLGLQPSVWFPADWLPVWGTVMLVAAAFAFNANGGAAVVSGVLFGLSPGIEEEVGDEVEAEIRERDSGIRGSGRLIGILERTLTLILILLGQWAAIVLLVAAKSIARFEELKERRFAEYYLVGTLASLLAAVLTGLVLRVALEIFP